MAFAVYADDAAAIRAVLDAQVAAWNRGDLEGYMAGYWKSPELTFFSGSTITHGWQPTLDRYRKRYQSEGKEMGTLTFSELRFDVAGKTAIVRGRRALKMKSGDSPNGLFTVILRRFNEGWRIVHDHSS
jgi:beta-aspartyl-peptidase (threonine type)